MKAHAEVDLAGLSGGPTRAHVMDIEVRPNGVLEYRWICSARCKPGKWSTSALRARRGGQRHVSAMERATTELPIGREDRR